MDYSYIERNSLIVKDKKTIYHEMVYKIITGGTITLLTLIEEPVSVHNPSGYSGIHWSLQSAGYTSKILTMERTNKEVGDS